MDKENSRNLILAIVLSGLVLIVWMVLFPPAPVEPPPADTTTSAPLAPGETAPPPAQEAPEVDDIAPAPAPEAPRVDIDTPRIAGSLSLRGGRIDSLVLKDYRETLDPDSPFVELLRPVGQDHAYYAVYGWGPAGGIAPDLVPGANTVFTLESGETLAPGAPVTLAWDNGQGQIFRRTYAVDDDYMFTVTQTVENTSASAFSLFPYGIVARNGTPPSTGFYLLHEGVIRQADNKLSEISYKNVAKLDELTAEGAQGEKVEVEDKGWIGFTDKYWMTTLIPPNGEGFTAVVKFTPGAQVYQVETRLPVRQVAAGATVSSETRLFAGAKEFDTIRDYQNNHGVWRFVDSIDWGWFFFLTKPIFLVLHWLHGFIGNMGWSIIALTVVLKALVLPLAYKSYVSMARMKELQPEMEKLKERAGDDRMKMQQEIMALYKREKVNPAAGCLPVLLQVPIFFSLYKVIFVTLELRHAPWIGWIRDLSAPDPSSILNLFGLLPFATPEVGSFFHLFSLGVLPIVLGISMWLQQKLNPAPTDATQAMIFAWMPWVFMFMLGSFASGLVLYWITNNTITFTQQYAIMRSHGSHPDVFGNILSSFRRKPKAAASKPKPAARK